jgi:hypothetical protein
MVAVAIGAETAATPARVSTADVCWFAMATVALSAAVLRLVPGIGGAALVVFVPAAVACIVVGLRCGLGQVRRQFLSRAAWRVPPIWLLVGLGVALWLRAGVRALGWVVGPDLPWASMVFLPAVLAVFVLAVPEEIGWRAFALAALVDRGVQPLGASLLLAAPWALLHLSLVAPGQLNEGYPPVALLLTTISLGVILSWGFLSSGGSLAVATAMHGGQNAFSFLTGTLDPGSAATVGWLMAAVYSAFALAVAAATRGRLGAWRQPDRED